MVYSSIERRITVSTKRVYKYVLRAIAIGFEFREITSTRKSGPVYRGSLEQGSHVVLVRRSESCDCIVNEHLGSFLYLCT